LWYYRVMKNIINSAKKSALNGIEQIKTAYQENQARQESELEAQRKQAHDRTLILKYGSLGEAKDFFDEQKRLRAIAERYPDDIAKFSGRIALVTNFNGESIPIGAAREKSKQAAAKVLDGALSDDVSLIVVESLVNTGKEYRLTEFDQSRDMLAGDIEIMSGIPTDTSSYLHKISTLRPVTILDRAETHQTEHSDKQIAYVGLVSTLELNGVGVPIEYAPFLGAYGEAYDSVKFGKVLVPSAEDPTRWVQNT
jgi:hypothetical protein